MARRVLTPKGEGKPIGMYSAGFDVEAGRLVFVAGQVAMDAEGRLVGEGDIAAQATQVYRNIERVLGEAGCRWRDVAKLTTFLTRAEDFAAFGEWRKREYARLFPDGVYPPNTGVVVQALARPGLLLEVEAIAVKPGRVAAPVRPTTRTTARRSTTRPAARRPARRAGRRRR
jgi:enamine deaminase RidA (YjgF/YER057c/UK114 family)